MDVLCNNAMKKLKDEVIYFKNLRNNYASKIKKDINNEYIKKRMEKKLDNVSMLYFDRVLSENVCDYKDHCHSDYDSYDVSKYTDNVTKNFELDVNESIKRVESLGYEILSLTNDIKQYHNYKGSSLCWYDEYFIRMKCKKNKYTFTVDGCDDCDCGVILRTRNIFDTISEIEYNHYCDLNCFSTNKNDLELFNIFLECDNYDEYFAKVYSKIIDIFEKLKQILYSSDTAVKYIVYNKQKNFLRLNDYYFNILCVLKYNDKTIGIVPYDNNLYICENIDESYLDPKLIFSGEYSSSKLDINTFNCEFRSNQRCIYNIHNKSIDMIMSEIKSMIDIIIYTKKRTYDIDGTTIISDKGTLNFVNEYSKQTQYDNRSSIISINVIPSVAGTKKIMTNIVLMQ